MSHSRFLVEENERAICCLIFLYNYSFCHLGENSIDGILGAIRNFAHVSYNRKRMDADAQVTAWWKAVPKQCFVASMRSTESRRCHHRCTIVIQRQTQRIHSILAAKIICLLFSISVYFLFERILTIDIKCGDDASFNSTHARYYVCCFERMSRNGAQTALNHNT